MPPSLSPISCGLQRAVPFLLVAVPGLSAALVSGSVGQPRFAHEGDTEQRALPVRVTWTVEADGEPAGAPATDAERVFLRLTDGRLVAFARSDGARLWAVASEARGSLVVDGGSLVYPTASGVTARRAADGAVLWAVRDPYPPGAEPAVASGWVVYGTTAGDLVARRGRDGAEVWRRAVGAPPAGRPAIDGEAVYVPLTDGRLVAFRLVSGEVRWQQVLGGRPDGAAAAPDRLFVGASDNYLYCLSPRDGRVLWRWRTAADIVAPPALDARHVYVVSLDNVLRALDRRTGSLRWRRLLESRHLGEPHVVAGLVVAPVAQPVMLFYAAASGRPVAGLNLPARLVAPPSALEAGSRGSRFFVVTIDSTGAVKLSAVEPGSDPPLGPLEDLPGRPLAPESRPVKPPTSSPFDAAR